MRSLGTLLSIAFVLLVLLDGFESMVLPRRVAHPFRFTRFFFRSTWQVWRVLASLVPAGPVREATYSIYGPMFLLALFGLWLSGLVIGFALLHFSLGTPVGGADGAAVSDMVTSARSRDRVGPAKSMSRQGVHIGWHNVSPEPSAFRPHIPSLVDYHANSAAA